MKYIRHSREVAADESRWMASADLLKKGITVSKGEDGPFYIVDVTATKQRILVPCGKARIVATANQGDGYTGINLHDPVFRRRWTGGWLQLKGHEADVVRNILPSGCVASIARCRAMPISHASTLAPTWKLLADCQTT